MNKFTLINKICTTTSIGIPNKKHASFHIQSTRARYDFRTRKITNAPIHQKQTDGKTRNARERARR